MLIESESGCKLLIDCGTDIRHSLHAQGYTHTDIDAVYVSHLHSDHAGGLEWLGFSKRFHGEKKATLYMSSDQIDQLWEHVLSGGMSSLEHEQATLSTYFNVKSINDSFSWENHTFQLIKTVHMISNSKIVPSYGLFITGGAQKILISTDTRFSPDSLQPIYDQADIIFHDCETLEKKSGQHAHYNDLKSLNKEIKKKIWLYDYNSEFLPNTAKQDGFQGFVISGQRFII